MDDYSAIETFIASIAAQYQIPKRRLRGTKLEQVISEEVRTMNRKNPNWKASEFPWDKILTRDEKLRPELLSGV